MSQDMTPMSTTYCARFVQGRFLPAAVLGAALGAVLVAVAVHALSGPRAQRALTPAAQLLALPGGTLVADPDYAYISLPGAHQAGYGVLYDGEKRTVGAYLVAQTATRAQAEALADRYFARAAHPIRSAGGALHATPSGGGDARSFVYEGMVGGTCSYGAGFVRGTAFYQLVLLSGASVPPGRAAGSCARSPCSWDNESKRSWSRIVTNDDE